MAITAAEVFLDDGIAPRTSKPGVWYVRIRPANKRSGNMLARYSNLRWGHRIKADRGWHELRTSNKDEIRDLVAAKNAGDERYAAPALDVCTWEESLVLKRKEAEAASRRIDVSADPENAHVLRSNNLPSTRRGRAESRRDMQQRIKDDAASDAEAREVRKAHRLRELEAQTEAERTVARERAEQAKIEAEEALRELQDLEGDAPADPQTDEELAAEIAKLDAEDEALMADTDAKEQEGAD